MTNEGKIQELLNEPCWNSKPYLIGIDKVDVEDVMERFAEWKDKQFEKEKKEIDEQWKRLMAESKSIGVSLLQRKEEQYKKEKRQWIEKAVEWLRMTMDFFNNGEFNTEKFVNDFKQEMKGE